MSSMRSQEDMPSLDVASPSVAMFMILVVCGILNQAVLSSAEPVTFAFTSFGHGSCGNDSDLICMGSVRAGEGYLSLTPQPPEGNSSVNMVGRVLYRYPVPAWPALITTTFTVRISAFPNSTGCADGMAFIMAQDSRPSPAGSFGSYLGIMDKSTEGGLLRQLAVELDTYMNEFDIDANHIGIDTTSISIPAAAKSLNGTGIDLKRGREVKVMIDYDGWSEILHISVGYAGKPLQSVLNHSIAMVDTVPGTVYVGFTGSTGTLSETHEILDWVFTSIPLTCTSSKCSGNDKAETILIIAFPVTVTLLVALMCGVLVGWRFIRRRNGRIRRRDFESRSRSAAHVPKMFTYKQLSKATHNFSKENLLGVGGFGSVYKGILFDHPSPVAVKKISATSEQGEREYLAEICTIGRLRHKNIVQLLGWCHEGKHLLLVYDYMPNGSLDRFIGRSFLDWETRFKILTGLASALLYLHEECGNPVVHRDVKPNNIMLDSEYNAQLGDFGLARLLQKDASVTTILAGTPGYLAPEVGFTGRATPESDVYSFGMVVLEVVCGRRSKEITEENSLVDCVWMLHGKNALLECVDSLLKGRIDQEQVKRTLVVGLACLHPDCMLRPSMRKVIQILLNPNEPLMLLPETRPSGIYVSLLSSSSATTTNFGSMAASSSLSDEKVGNATQLQYRKGICA